TSTRPQASEKNSRSAARSGTARATKWRSVTLADIVQLRVLAPSRRLRSEFSTDADAVSAWLLRRRRHQASRIDAAAQLAPAILDVAYVEAHELALLVVGEGDRGVADEVRSRLQEWQVVRR